VLFSALAAAVGSALPLADAGTVLFSWSAIERRERDGQQRDATVKAERSELVH
jgi:hypothetical protein